MAKLSTKVDELPGVSGHRIAQQSRSAKTEAKFLEAAGKLFAERGYSGTRVADIIKESGCSTGSFYHRFSDKEGVFRLLLQQYVDDMKTLVFSYDMGQSAHGTVWNLYYYHANITIDAVSNRLGFYKAVQELSLEDVTVMDTLKDITLLIGDLVTDVSAEYIDQIGAPDPAQAMRRACQLIITVIWRTQMGEGILYPKDQDELCKMLADACCGILHAKIPGDK
jgi:AcrR family transcriptional regulator